MDRSKAFFLVFLDFSRIFWSNLEATFPAALRASSPLLLKILTDFIITVSIVVIIPIFDFLLYPWLRKKGINFTPIKRIFVGFLFVGLAMAYAAVLQHYIYAGSPCHDNLPSACLDADGYIMPAEINVWVISGVYILVGIGEIFASITSLEYAFTKAPLRMKSVVVAFSQFQTAISSALNFALTPLNAENLFIWLFGSFAIVSWITGFILFWAFYDLDQEEIRLNQIGLGERPGYADENKEESRAEKA